MGIGSDVLDPVTTPEAHDYIQVNGILNPGIAKLSGFKRDFGWEVKKGKGAKGSTVTLNEYPPAEGTVTLVFWLQDHFEQWREFRDIWDYDPTKKPIKAVDIYHPTLADLGINRVVCKSIGAVEPDSTPGLWKVVLTLIEYNPPPKKPAVSTPKGEDQNKKKNGGDEDLDPQQREIKKLLEEAKKP